MPGVIAGDVVGSIFELEPTKSMSFELLHPLSHFTDDTVLTVATASAILRGTEYGRAYRELGRRYPRAGYGETFYGWLHGHGALIVECESHRRDPHRGSVSPAVVWSRLVRLLAAFEWTRI